MTSERARRILAWFVGGIFIVMGLIELGVRLLSDEPIDPEAIAWWSLSLLGGGTLVLLGSFVIKSQTMAFAALVVGCLVGIVATMWTLIIPLFAFVLLFLSSKKYAGRNLAPPKIT